MMSGSPSAEARTELWMRVGTNRMRNRRASRPVVESLEGRALLAIMQSVSPAAALAFTSLGGSTNQGSYALAGDPNSVDLAMISGAGLSGAESFGTVNYSGDNSPLSPDKQIELDAFAYAENYSSATSKLVTSGTGNANEINGSYIAIKILPDGISGEQIGDPVSVTLTGTYGHSILGGSSQGQTHYQIGYNPTGGANDFHNLLGPTTDNNPSALNPRVTQQAQFVTTIGSTFYVALSSYAAAAQGQGSQSSHVDCDLTLALLVDDLPKPTSPTGGGGASAGGGGASGGGGGVVGGGGSTSSPGSPGSAVGTTTGTPAAGTSGGLTPEQLALLLLLDSPSTSPSLPAVPTPVSGTTTPVTHGHKPHVPKHHVPKVPRHAGPHRKG